MCIYSQTCNVTADIGYDPNGWIIILAIAVVVSLAAIFSNR